MPGRKCDREGEDGKEAAKRLIPFVIFMNPSEQDFLGMGMPVDANINEFSEKFPFLEICRFGVCAFWHRFTIKDQQEKIAI